MKKVKIMLTLIALLAVTAGIWSFNVKTLTKVCTGATVDNGAGAPTCLNVNSDGTAPITTGIHSGSSICYTTTSAAATTCSTSLSTPNLASQAGEQ